MSIADVMRVGPHVGVSALIRKKPELSLPLPRPSHMSVL